jgi:hypothetical protein
MCPLGSRAGLPSADAEFTFGAEQEFPRAGAPAKLGLSG